VPLPSTSTLRHMKTSLSICRESVAVLLHQMHATELYWQLEPYHLGVSFLPCFPKRHKCTQSCHLCRGLCHHSSEALAQCGSLSSRHSLRSRFQPTQGRGWCRHRQPAPALLAAYSRKGKTGSLAVAPIHTVPASDIWCASQSSLSKRLCLRPLYNKAYFWQPSP